MCKNIVSTKVLIFQPIGNCIRVVVEASHRFTLRKDLCNASTSCFTTTWDKISNWLINKDLCRNSIFAYLQWIRKSVNIYLEMIC